MPHSVFKGPYPRVFTCPDCASELEPDERGNPYGLCGDCIKERINDRELWTVQADPFPIE